MLLTRRKPAALPIRVLPGKLGALRTGQLLARFLQEPTHHLQGKHTEQDQNRLNIVLLQQFAILLANALPQDLAESRSTMGPKRAGQIPKGLVHNVPDAAARLGNPRWLAGKSSLLTRAGKGCSLPSFFLFVLSSQAPTTAPSNWVQWGDAGLSQHNLPHCPLTWGSVMVK